MIERKSCVDWVVELMMVFILFSYLSKIETKISHQSLQWDGIVE